MVHFANLVARSIIKKQFYSTCETGASHSTHMCRHTVRRSESLNQRGFCRGAQTSDHVFTLNTCIEKYVKVQRKRIYSCFVDFQKAFDAVSREALLYKLNKRFFYCLQYMYRNSKARLKIIKKLSACFDVNAGTEQGHPLSSSNATSMNPPSRLTPYPEWKVPNSTTLGGRSGRTSP